MGCNALKIQEELIGEVLKEHFPGVSENSVLATKFVGPALFKLARHHLGAVAKVNKLDSKLKDRLLDFGINEKSNQAQAGNGNKTTNEKSTKIPSRIFDSSGNQLDLNGTKEEAIAKLDKYKKEFTKAIEDIGSEPDYDAKTVKYWEDMFKKRLAEVQEDLDDVSNGVYDKEFKNTENTATGFQGYVGGFEDKGKGTPEGDGKDKAMRKVANGFIGESVTPVDVQSLKQIKPTSSTVTSFKAIGTKVSHNDYSNTGVTLVSGTDHTIVMLARNSEFKGKPLAKNTKDNILESHKDGATFVVGDMPGVDTQFIEYLNEIGASYKIYHTGSTARIKEEVRIEDQINTSSTEVENKATSTLTNEQAKVKDSILEFFASDRPHHVIDAAGGTGKTYTVGKAIQELTDYMHSKKKRAKNVRFLAPSHAAKEVLSQASGEEAMTIQAALGLKPVLENGIETGKFAKDVFSQPKIGEGDWVVVDEASMISDYLYDLLIKEIGPNGKILFMGDKAQFPPIQAKGNNRVGLSYAIAPKDSKTKVDTLTKVIRFDGSSSIGTITEALRDNSLNKKESPLKVLTELDLKLDNSTTVEADEDKAISEFEEKVKSDPMGTVIVTYNNESENNKNKSQSVNALNKRIHNDIYPDSNGNFVSGQPIVTYDSAQGISEAGYVVDVYNSVRSIISDVSEVIEATEFGVTLKYQDATMADGTKVKLLHNSDAVKKEIKSKAYKAGRYKDGLEAVAKYLHVEHGYAITGHKAQGQTFNNVTVMLDNIASMDGVADKGTVAAAAYVGMSRPKQHLTIVSKHLKTAPRAKEEVKVDKTVVETNTSTVSTKVGILNGKVGMLSKTGKSLETKVEIKSMEQLIDLAADFNMAIEEYHGREIKDESVDHMVSMFKELVSVKDFKPFTLKFDNSVEGLGLATGNNTITMTTNADAYKKVFGSPIRIVLHEYVHTITQMEMKNNPNNEVVKKIQALYDRVKNREELKGEYGLTDVYEFVAEALSNPRFQAKLDKIGSKHTLVNKIKELFKSLLTWRKDEGGVTVLDEILDLAVSLKNEKLNDAGKSKQKYGTVEDYINELQGKNKRQVATVIQRIEQEQEKRKYLLSDRQALKEYAENRTSVKNMKELLVHNYQENKTRLKVFKEYYDTMKDDTVKKVFGWNNIEDSQAETKQEDATILDKNADKTANNLYKWAKECTK